MISCYWIVDVRLREPGVYFCTFSCNDGIRSIARSLQVRSSCYRVEFDVRGVKIHRFMG
jgi:hypothetical protein